MYNVLFGITHYTVLKKKQMHLLHPALGDIRDRIIRYQGQGSSQIAQPFYTFFNSA